MVSENSKTNSVKLCPNCKGKIKRVKIEYQHNPEKILNNILMKGKIQLGETVVWLDEKENKIIVESPIFQCNSCKQKYCPNSDFKLFHKDISKIKPRTRDRRGKYDYCYSCKWYPFLELENLISQESEEIFRNELFSELETSGLDILCFELKSREITSKDEWLPLKQRYKRYGSPSKGDFSLYHNSKEITRFELKRWGQGWSAVGFWNSKAYITPKELKDIAKLDGYIVFIITRDGEIYCAKSNEIYSSIKNKESSLAFIGKDNQGNKRIIVTKEGKRKFCKRIRSIIPDISIKVL